MADSAICSGVTGKCGDCDGTCTAPVTAQVTITFRAPLVANFELLRCESTASLSRNGTGTGVAWQAAASSRGRMLGQAGSELAGPQADSSRAEGAGSKRGAILIDRAGSGRVRGCAADRAARRARAIVATQAVDRGAARRCAEPRDAERARGTIAYPVASVVVAAGEDIALRNAALFLGETAPVATSVVAARAACGAAVRAADFADDADAGRAIPCLSARAIDRPRSRRWTAGCLGIAAGSYRIAGSHSSGAEE